MQACVGVGVGPRACARVQGGWLNYIGEVQPRRRDWTVVSDGGDVRRAAVCPPAAGRHRSLASTVRRESVRLPLSSHHRTRSPDPLPTGWLPSRLAELPPPIFIFVCVAPSPRQPWHSFTRL